MERSALTRKTSHTQWPRTDRFVAPRETLEDMRRRISWPPSCSDVDTWGPKYVNQQKYTRYLNNAFGLEPPHQQSPILWEQQEVYVQPWPCIPRKRKHLSSADNVLDLPRYEQAIFPDLLDWSVDNILVAALGSVYHKWSWQTQSQVSHGATLHDIKCCKFNPTGDLLAFGTDNKRVEIHDSALSKCTTTATCSPGARHGCFITAVDWSPTGNSYVMGCSLGRLISYTRNSLLISMKQASQDPILSLRISPNARFLAVMSVNTDVVLLLCWPSLKPYSILDTNISTMKSIAWHPWRSALLAVGTVTTDMYPHLVLCNVPNSKINGYFLSRCHYCLDNMLFSQRTGELIVSLSNTENHSRLVIMSDPNTVVDQCEKANNLDRVRTMLLNPDETKLATATAKEDLIIWNFLPEHKRTKKKTKSKIFSALPVYLDNMSDGYSLR